MRAFTFQLFVNVPSVKKIAYFFAIFNMNEIDFLHVFQSVKYLKYNVS